VKSGIGFSGNKCRSRPVPSVTIRARSFHPFWPILEEEPIGEYRSDNDMPAGRILT